MARTFLHKSTDITDTVAPVSISIIASKPATRPLTTSSPGMDFLSRSNLLWRSTRDFMSRCWTPRDLGEGPDTSNVTRLQLSPELPGELVVVLTAARLTTFCVGSELSSTCKYGIPQWFLMFRANLACTLLL